ncbi:matrixin family metalloprotease [Pleurocapsales cyanobacterium LEGE 10410]|nr:matrixin family metalloprotease [Pleurocapsales cyanobacterium LEGE 10410]
MNQWRLKWHRIIVLAIAIFFTILAVQNFSVYSQPSLSSDLPPSRVHPLPSFLANWQDRTNSGDYFEAVEPSPLGYLVWSRFPLKVYVEQPTTATNSAADIRFKQWVTAVRQAIAEWNVYIPLKEITEQETADIVIWRSQPEREIKLNSDTGLYDIPRAVAAETNYEFYLTEDPAVIALRMTIQISPNFAGVSLLATVRHELGHALGIWGHSSQPSDALYFSQVSDPPPISSRDINTLKKIYQQPTKLGWKI